MAPGDGDERVERIVSADVQITRLQQNDSGSRRVDLERAFQYIRLQPAMRVGRKVDDLRAPKSKKSHRTVNRAMPLGAG